MGAMGPQGPAVANYTGNYASATNYTLHDAVSFNGSTYISLIAGNVGNTPDQSPAQWAVLAAQGPAGPTGATGACRSSGRRRAQPERGPGGAAGASGELSRDVAGWQFVWCGERGWFRRIELCGVDGKRGPRAGC